MSFVINRRDLEFLLYELLDIETLCERSRFSDHARDTFDPMLDTAETIAREFFEGHAAIADEHEPSFDGVRVTLVDEVKPAVDAFFEAGFGSATHDYEEGGMQLPETIHSACHFIFNSANVGTAGYPFLTVAAANLIRAHGSEEQRTRYVKPMISGRFFGTMCLSEPHAGSSLSDIRTKAVPQTDGTYKISGNKMWISAGEHELSENIVHMVLAKIPGGPPGVKGISLFIVPKFRLDANGDCAERNDVQLAGLNHKMGFRGTTNTLLNFGENDNCVGYLVGEAHRGLAYMFHMMNEARIGVGMTATALGYAGYLYSLDYAKERPQGRLPSAKNPESPQIPIVEHTDVRRMLLVQKAYVEGALALCLYCSHLVDEQHTAEDPKAREEAGQLLEVLTPIAKAWPSEWCLEANKWAIQILGGYGYTRDYPVERLYRDNRLNMIHEGTNGIQGMDLLGRKVLMHGGAAFTLLISRINDFADKASNNAPLASWAQSLREAAARVADTTQKLMSLAMKGEIDLFLANASAYLDMTGHLVLSWIWLRQAEIAHTKLSSCTDADRDFYKGKLQACQYYFRWELPKTVLLSERLIELDDTFLQTDVAYL